LAADARINLRSIWRNVTEQQVADIREAISGLMRIGESARDIAESAGVNTHDVTNFMSGKAGRPGHKPGVRLIRYIGIHRGRFKDTNADLHKRIEWMEKFVSDRSNFEIDLDHFYNHLERLGVIDEKQCAEIADIMSGHYFSYRLGSSPNTIIKSHYEFMKYNAYNKLPHFLNRLRYLEEGSLSEIRRTAEGQLIKLGNNFVTIAFVYQGITSKERKISGKEKYEGIQVNIFPCGAFPLSAGAQVEGLFLSYVLRDRYEFGKMILQKIAATPKGYRFIEQDVGSFDLHDLEEKEPDIKIDRLRLNVSSKINIDEEGDDLFELASCLSFVLGSNVMSFK